MLKNLLISGDNKRILAFVNFLISIDYPINLHILNTDLSVSINNLISTVLCDQFNVSISDTSDYSNIDGFIYLYDFPENIKDDNIDFLKEKISNFRLSVNDIIEKGFTGTIILNGFRDDLLNYFANKFTGKSSNYLIGTGTLPSTLVLKNILKRYFNVGSSDITISIFGNNINNFISWSRSYIGQTPILSYLSDKNNLFKDDVLDEINYRLDVKSLSEDEILQFKSIKDILDSLYLDLPHIMDLSNLKLSNGKLSSLSSPVIINNKGLYQYIKVSLSDNEESTLNSIVDESNIVINEIINGSKK
ncbi:Rossmann-fold NAD(P)-binding domain-containing protein [Apilactobacillus timberlakei]|uniref:hypothetical protein n=1 Tax=Apilactobacillus timberlakei TaxID=2008380 RepID=UPI00112E9508|nr:hypothetical protein [Apilactobacillus timberlakei]TPR17395.1 hypothetical protein DYZ95_05260 [Apilactobacillus timberlakei]